MHFDLSTLLEFHDDLDWMQEPFSAEEIDQVVKNLSSNKSPGSDGFNGDLLKKCWYIIAQDFYALLAAFYEGEICLHSINGSYVTLVPKKDAPTLVGDFRPISLLNSSIKLITKLLANRLQKVIINLVHTNQYGFIKTRTIHDCLAWAFEYLHLCHKSKKEIIIVKLDFKKAFDKVEHHVILDILKHKGLGKKWLNWMEMIMNSATSSILLNGVPGKTFHCKRGVRQGDPLSPLLFVLAADLLQSIINKAKSNGLLNLPLPRAGSDFLVIQYADDTLLVMEACPRQLSVLKALLNAFADSTGLKVNYSKSMMVPINVSPERMEILTRTFGCQQGSMPFTYFRLPLGYTKPFVQDFLPFVQRIERRLVGCAQFLTQAGKLEMVNSVLTSRPMFLMCTLKLHKTIIEMVDIYRKHLLWRGSDINGKKPPLAAWDMVCTPKHEGGLGGLQLSTQNDALLMKFLHKFYNRADIPWVTLIWDNYYTNGKLPGDKIVGSFWWRDVMKLNTQYKGIASVKAGDGSTIWFWQDLWNGSICAQDYPKLFSFAKKANLSLQEVWSAPNFIELFHLPLSEQAYEQMQQLYQVLQDVDLEIEGFMAIYLG